MKIAGVSIWIWAVGLLVAGGAAAAFIVPQAKHADLVAVPTKPALPVKTAKKEQPLTKEEHQKVMQVCASLMRAKLDEFNAFKDYCDLRAKDKNNDFSKELERFEAKIASRHEDADRIEKELKNMPETKDTPEMPLIWEFRDNLTESQEYLSQLYSLPLNSSLTATEMLDQAKVIQGKLTKLGERLGEIGETIKLVRTANDR